MHQKAWGQLTWANFETASEAEKIRPWATWDPGLSCECWETKNLYKGPTPLTWQLVPFHHPVVVGGHEKGDGVPIIEQAVSAQVTGLVLTHTALS